jgi:hypothetical protein
MVREKLRIVREAEEIGNCAAGRKYDVPESCIRDWRGKKEMLLKSSGTRRDFCGQKARYPKIEEKLLECMSEKHKFGYAVSTEMCQLKALALAKEQGIDGFKASHGWIMRFFYYFILFYTRNELCIRRKTSVSQRLPNAYEEKILCFQKYFISLWWQQSYIVSQIGNADQTPVYFEMPLDTMVHKKGDKNVTVKTGGNEKQQCTVMLCFTTDGRKLPPYIILRRKTLPKVNVKGVIVQTQESGWMDQVLVLDWIIRMWQKCPGAFLNIRSMLILDSFRGRATEEVKKFFKSRNIDQVIIPGGLTLMLQPLDVCINRLFKAAPKEQYTEWMAAGGT